jgi:hypothetical protein
LTRWVAHTLTNEIVFAADSRTAFSDSYSDQECKIRAFDDKVLFATSGRNGQRNKITHVYSWNADAIAKNAFVAAVEKGASQHIADQLASSWGIAMKKQLEQDIAANRDLALANIETDGTMALGAFADFGNDGTFLILVEKLAYSPTTDASGTVKASVSYRVTSPGPPYYLGKGEIIREYDANRTSRSKEWKRDMEMGLGFAGDPTVFKAKKLVELTIDNYPATRTDASGKKFSVVGGKIAIAKLTPNGFDWVDPGNCSQTRSKAGTQKKQAHK